VTWHVQEGGRKAKQAKGRPWTATHLPVFVCLAIALLVVCSDEVGDLVADLLGTVLGSSLVLCFFIGLGARLVLLLGRVVSDPGRKSDRQPRHVGRAWADDVPSRRRVSRGSTDPSLPLRGRRR